MLDVQAIRTALAAAAPANWNAYDFVPGSATVPALVVALPERITFDGSLRTVTIAIPVFVAVGPNISPEAEKSLLTNVVALATTYTTLKSEHFRSCRVVQVTDFQTLTIGSNEVYGAAVDLELLANT